jgi:hypothetical protein
MSSSRSHPRARVPAALSLLLAAALSATPLASYAEEPTLPAEPTATAEPSATAEPTAMAEPTATAEPSATADPVPTAEPGAPAVFPDVDRIGPGAAPYVVQLDVPDVDTVVVSTPGWSTRVAASGPVEVEFPWNGPHRVSVQGCRAETCEVVAVGPEVVVRRTVAAELQLPPGGTVGPATPIILGFPTWAVEDREGQVGWELVSDAGSVIATGETVYQPLEGSENGASFDLDVPDGAGTDGRLRVRLTDDVAGFGLLQSDLAGSIAWDGRVQARLKLPRTELYPVRDRYLDSMPVSLSLDEALSRGRVQVVDAAGTVVRTLLPDVADLRSSHSAAWDGRDDAGVLVPTGSYLVKAVLADRRGNATTLARPVEVHDEEVVRQVWKQTFRASDTVIDTAVGRCSDYRTPSSRRDRGSFQLASQTRCRTASQSHAIALSGVYLPASMKHSYTGITVTMRGGPSTGARGAYVVLAFPQENGKLQSRRVLRGAYGKHAISVRQNGQVLRKEKDGRRYVPWQAGLTEGSRWDVESYTVRAVIKVLR